MGSKRDCKTCHDKPLYIYKLTLFSNKKISNPNKYREAMKEAQQYLKKQKEENFSLFDLESTRPWTEESDDLFFSRRRRGLASWLIPTGSPIYYEFEGRIYIKFHSIHHLTDIIRILSKIERQHKQRKGA